MRTFAEITDAKNDEKPCEVNLYLDKSSLDLLIKRLVKMTSPGDHIHMMSHAWGGDDLSEEKIDENNNTVHHLKITLLE